ncbi:MAG: DUF72 domain-containing protein, partial [Chloroflexi bacterium]|nr:DUF72 domain-containing protein [Chloroflexota bacterium]
MVPELSKVQAIGGVKIRVGMASWTDPTPFKGRLVSGGVSTGEARLRFYSDRFPIVEADAPFYAIPSPSVAQLWVRRTSDSFRFNVKAFAPLRIDCKRERRRGLTGNHGGMNQLRLANGFERSTKRTRRQAF